MFGVGFSEFLIIAFAIILFIKPEDIPKVFRFLGKLAGKARAAYDEAVSVKDRIMNEVDDAADFDNKENEKKEDNGNF
jgi:Sec-independent protein translocase protein TatA